MSIYSGHVLAIQRGIELLYLHSFDSIPQWTTQLEQAHVIRAGERIALIKKFPAGSLFTCGLDSRQRLQMRQTRFQENPQIVHFQFYKNQLTLPDRKLHIANVRFCREQIKPNQENRRVEKYRAPAIQVWFDVSKIEVNSLAFESRDEAVEHYGTQELSRLTVQRKKKL